MQEGRDARGTCRTRDVPWDGRDVGRDGRDARDAVLEKDVTSRDEKTTPPHRSYRGTPILSEFPMQGERRPP